MVKFGFLIDDGKIYDTKIQGYTQKKEIIGKNVIYSMTLSYYKRLYLFEALLSVFSVEKVFRILEYNKYLKKQRNNVMKNVKPNYMANAAVIYNYPPTYLTKRKFSLYKICQEQKKMLD